MCGFTPLSSVEAWRDNRRLFLPLELLLALHDEKAHMANNEDRFKGLYYGCCAILGVQ